MLALRTFSWIYPASDRVPILELGSVIVDPLKASSRHRERRGTLNIYSVPGRILALKSLFTKKAPVHLTEIQPKTPKCGILVNTDFRNRC